MRFLIQGMRFLFALGLVGLLTACPLPPPAPKAPAALYQAAVDGAYAQWRYIGIRAPGLEVCPDAGAGWKASPLFAVSSQPDDDPATVAVIARLQRFCVYEAARVASPPRPPEAGAGLVQADPDVAALVAAGSHDDLQTMTATPLQVQFENQIGLGQPLPPRTANTRLIFLDTQPTGSEAPLEPGKSLHGYTLAQLAADVVCGPAAGPGDTPCPQIATQLAMPRLRFDSKNPAKSRSNQQTGGYFGTLTDLATAISSAVEGWHRCRKHPLAPGCAGTPRNLILNLSLGWDPAAFGGLEPNADGLKTPAQTVYYALRYAAIRGVLVVAASGNVSGGTPSPAGPTLPAAWEGSPPMDSLPSGNGPLLYAAGALRADGQPLGSMRLQAMPLRAAFADHVVVGDRTGRPLPPMTGTSVAAAVVSAVAAVVWDYRPDLDRDGVMDLLTRQGLPLADRAYFWNPGATPASPAPTATRVTLCAAVTAACSGHPCGSTGAALPSCAALETPAFPSALSLADQSFQAHVVLDGSSFEESTAPATQCSTPVTLRFPRGQNPANPCPDQDSVALGAGPWVYPQPEQDPCPPCNLQSGGTTVAAMHALSLRHATTPPAPLPATTRSRFRTSLAQTTTSSGAAAASAVGGGVDDPGGVGASAPWTLLLKIRDSWPCMDMATLNLEVIDQGSGGRTRISYAIPGPLCSGASVELTGIAIPRNTTLDSAWLSFLEHGFAVRSQLLVSQQ